MDRFTFLDCLYDGIVYGETCLMTLGVDKYSLRAFTDLNIVGSFSDAPTALLSCLTFTFTLTFSAIVIACSPST